MLRNLSGTSRLCGEVVLKLNGVDAVAIHMELETMPPIDSFADELRTVAAKYSEADRPIVPVTRYCAARRDWDGLDAFMDEVVRRTLGDEHLTATTAPDYNDFHTSIGALVAGALQRAHEEPAIVAFVTSFYFDGSDDGRFALYLCDKGPNDAEDWPAFFLEDHGGPLVYPYLGYWTGIYRTDPTPANIGYRHATNRLISVIGRVWERDGDPRFPFAYDDTEGFFPILL